MLSSKEFQIKQISWALENWAKISTYNYIYIFYFYKCEPVMTPTPGVFKETTWRVFFDLSIYFVFTAMLSTSDLISSLKSSFVYELC